MRQLARQVGERVHLSVRRDGEVLTILTEGPHRAVETVQWMGQTAPISCTSPGRVLLFDHSDDEIRTLLQGRFRKGSGSKAPTSVDAVIDRVNRARAVGYAAVIDEFDDDLAGVAAPVRDGLGRIIAACNVSAPTYRLLRDLDGIGRQVVQAAKYLGHALSSPTPSTAPVQERDGAIPGFGGDTRTTS
jgi:DNA-binding IclR family transcriptional regulator